MQMQPSFIIGALVFAVLFVIHSTNGAIIGTTNTQSNSVISNYRVQPKELAAVKRLQLIKYLGFVPADGQKGNETTMVELHPNDEFALERCGPAALLYELLNFQLHLYLSLEKPSYRSDLLPVCERVEKCVGSMHTMASRSEDFQERLMSPIFMVLKQAIKLVCNLERRESKVNVNSIVDTTQAVYKNFMMVKNLMKTISDVGLF